MDDGFLEQISLMVVMMMAGLKDMRVHGRRSRHVICLRSFQFTHAHTALIANAAVK